MTETDSEGFRSLSDQVLDAIIHADCYCKPGDPTCEDWHDEEERWASIHHAVMEVLRPPEQYFIPVLDSTAEQVHLHVSVNVFSNPEEEHK